MQKAISKYGLAAHLALLAVAPLFLFPFCGAVWTARVLLWLSFLAFVWTLVEPSRRQGEMLHDARLRVFLSVFRDPLFWFSLFLSLVAFVRWLNGGVAMAYDAENAVWSLHAPALAFLPGSVSGSGYLPFAATLAATVLMQGCRHALGRSARGAFLFIASFLAGVASVSAIVAAAGGMKVAKHGNRAASSLSGTADCLEALGVNINQSPARCVELLKEVGMCFFFAQKYHTSMKYVGAIRRELGFRTVFNILGPLTNPGSPKMQLLGVYDEYLVEPLAQVLVSLGVKRGMVVYGMDKLDEISLSAPTKICEIKDGWFRSCIVTPEEFGFERCSKADLKGGTPAENAATTRAILSGQQGHKRNAVLMNAGAALYIGGKADSMEKGVVMAADIIDSGAALRTLEKFIEVSNRPEAEA